MAQANTAVYESLAQTLLDTLNGGFTLTLYDGFPPVTADDATTASNHVLSVLTISNNQLERTTTTLSKIATPAAWEDQSANAGGVPTFARVESGSSILQLTVGKTGVTYTPEREVLITVPDTLDLVELGITADDPYIVAGGFVAIDSFTLELHDA